MNTPVSFELAKLLKEKEYKDKNMLGTVRLSEPEYYDPNGIIHNIKDIFEEKDYKIEDCFNAPTIVEVVMWLYEKHGIWIESTMGKDHTGVWFDWDIFSTITPRKDDVFGEEGVEYEDSPNEKWLNYDTTYSSMIDEHFATMDKKSCSSPAEAYEAAIEYTLKNLL